MLSDWTQRIAKGAWAILCCAASVLLPRVAVGDSVYLEGGGEIRGQIDAANSTPSEIHVVLPSGIRVTVARSSVSSLVPRSPKLEAYETRARAVEDTVAARWELAQWCAEQKLLSQRREQLHHIVRLDPQHRDARRALGHVEVAGQWYSREEAMERNGYVRHNGRWVTQQELDLIAQKDKLDAATRQWYPRVRLIVDWLTGSSGRRRTEAVVRLAAIDDPHAIEALQQFLGTHRDVELRRMYLNTLQQIEGKAIVAPIVALSLYDESRELRHEALACSWTDEQEALATRLYVRQLASPRNDIVQRAAYALGRLGRPEAVPELIAALVTTHQEKVNVPVPTQSYAVGGGNIGFGSSSVDLSTLPPGVAAGVATGTMPYTLAPNPYQSDRMATKTVSRNVQVQNREVLAALHAITGRNFGFDERAWRLWYSEALAYGEVVPKS